MQIKYILVGEMHGTKECPEEFLKIIRKHKLNQASIEYPSKGIANDGRQSQANKKLIKELRKNKIKIFFIEGADEIMAKKLMKIKGKIAFLCGRVHARKKDLQLSKKSRYYKLYPKGLIKTCGSLLPKNETISYKIHAINGGTYYNFGIKKYPKNKTRHKTPVTIKSKNKAYDYIRIIDKFNYSPSETS